MENHLGIVNTAALVQEGGMQNRGMGGRKGKWENWCEGRKIGELENGRTGVKGG